MRSNSGKVKWGEVRLRAFAYYVAYGYAHAEAYRRAVPLDPETLHWETPKKSAYLLTQREDVKLMIEEAKAEIKEEIKKSVMSANERRELLADIARGQVPKISWRDRLAAMQLDARLSGDLDKSKGEQVMLGIMGARKVSGVTLEGRAERMDIVAEMRGDAQALELEQSNDMSDIIEGKITAEKEGGEGNHKI